MPDIVLTTLNAKYIHSAFGLRYLLANLGELREQACIREFDIHQRPVDIAEALLTAGPKIIGLGVYIWNVSPATDLVRILKRLRPEVTIVLGGPEVSYEPEKQAIVAAADYVISGEADLAFGELCRQLLGGRPPGQKLIPAAVPGFSQLALPYELYSNQDIASRILYVEASRGCPFSCEFCLSSLDIPVRQAPLPALLAALDHLLERGAKHLKFVDRTFNLNPIASRSILQFCLERYEPGRLFHFEVVPDRIPQALRDVIAKFPAGALQFEVGVQTFNESAAGLISRRQNYALLEENFQFLRRETGVHIHADLIAGLPGESLASFAAGFDKLVSLRPQEIQVGMLKRLRGTPIARHTEEWGMVYNPNPPYELLENKLLDFATMQMLRRFSRHWDIVANSGNFLESTPLIWESGVSPFYSFLRWSQWLHAQVGRTDGIALLRVMRLLFTYMSTELRLDQRRVAEILWRDYQRGGRFDKPDFLKDFLTGTVTPEQILPNRNTGIRRQAKHQRQVQRPRPSIDVKSL